MGRVKEFRTTQKSFHFRSKPGAASNLPPQYLTCLLYYRCRTAAVLLLHCQRRINQPTKLRAPRNLSRARYRVTEYIHLSRRRTPLIYIAYCIITYTTQRRTYLKYSAAVSDPRLPTNCTPHADLISLLSILAPVLVDAIRPFLCVLFAFAILVSLLSRQRRTTSGLAGLTGVELMVVRMRLPPTLRGGPIHVSAT